MVAHKRHLFPPFKKSAILSVIRQIRPESPISTGKKMTTERDQIHPQELIERLRLKVAALEQRIRDKNELVEEIKSF